MNAQGRVAWIGHPIDMDTVLRKVVDNTWDIKGALSKRTFNRHLEDLDGETAYKLRTYEGSYDNPKDMGRPDSALVVINEIVRKEPKLKYTPVMALFTFEALLKTNPHKAYEYGKEAIVTPTYEDPAYDSIIGRMEDYSDRLSLPAEVYLLGAEAYQIKIDRLPYPELEDMPKLYRKMSAWYRLAGDEPKAVEAEQKAVKLTKNN